MNKCRRILLPSLPLLLGALLGGAKWKQMHPTPTKLDLQARAHSREARIVELVEAVNCGRCPLVHSKRA